MRMLNILMIATSILFLTSACSSNIINTLQSTQEVRIESVPSGSDVYKLIKKGEKIKIVNETDVWYEVELENQKKYIRKKNILKID